MDTQIIAKDLVKEFQVVHKSSGIRGSIQSLIHPQKTIIRAVDNVSFSVQKGEIVGFLGANGAGKSTTIKMLCCILHPTSGEIQINSYYPYKQRKKIVRDLGVIFGQRSQLLWELRLGESFELQKIIYGIPEKEYQKTLSELDEILHFSDFINNPVRQLSLGQRMRGDFVAAMLHRPSIVFLDEPTIGLDTQTKYAIRDFIKIMNEEHRTTILITTHDMSDIEALCNRLIVIHNGKILEDGNLGYLKDKYSPYRSLSVTVDGELKAIPPYKEITFAYTDTHVIMAHFKKEECSIVELLAHLSNYTNVVDVTVKEPNMDDVMLRLEQ